MIEGNGAFKHDRYERICLRVMSSITVFAMHGRQRDGRTTAGPLAGWMNTTDYIDPYAARMDQKNL